MSRSCSHTRPDTGSGLSASSRWSDIDLDGDTIRWRSEHEKTGYEHVTPMTDEAVAVLEEAREANPGSGETPVLPARKDPSASISHGRAGTWWRKAERLAGLEPKAGRGWHSLRRKFASAT